MQPIVSKVYQRKINLSTKTTKIYTHKQGSAKQFVQRTLSKVYYQNNIILLTKTMKYTHKQDTARNSCNGLLVKFIIKGILSYQQKSIYLYFPPSSQLLYLCFCPVGNSNCQLSKPSDRRNFDTQQDLSKMS